MEDDILEHKAGLIDEQIVRREADEGRTVAIHFVQLSNSLETWNTRPIVALWLCGS